MKTEHLTTGELIKIRRKEQGMTQNQLAKKMGVPYQSIGQWEKNKRNPKFETLQKIAKALGINVWELWGDTREGYEENKDFLSTYPEAYVIRNDDEVLITAGHLEARCAYIVRLFRNLNDDGQLRAVEDIMALAKKTEYQKGTKKSTAELTKLLYRNETAKPSEREIISENNKNPE